MNTKFHEYQKTNYFFMSNKIVYIFISVLFISCGGDKKNPVSNDADPKTEKTDSLNEKDSLEKSDTLIINATLSFEDKAEKLKEKYSDEYGKSESDKSIFPERFASEWSMNFFCNKPAAEFYFLKYADTLGRQNVMNNWLNCFGNDCISIKENETKTGFKSGHCLVIINEKEIIYFAYDCEGNESVAGKIISELKYLFGNKKSKYLGIYCNGVLKWK